MAKGINRPSRPAFRKLYSQRHRKRIPYRCRQGHHAAQQHHEHAACPPTSTARGGPHYGRIHSEVAARPSASSLVRAGPDKPNWSHTKATPAREMEVDCGADMEQRHPTRQVPHEICVSLGGSPDYPTAWGRFKACQVTLDLHNAYRNGTCPSRRQLPAGCPLG